MAVRPVGFGQRVIEPAPGEEAAPDVAGGPATGHLQLDRWIIDHRVSKGPFDGKAVQIASALDRHRPRFVASYRAVSAPIGPESLSQCHEPPTSPSPTTGLT